jgi:very-short-patch-repair endonuclease
MASRTNIFTTIRTEGALLPADLLQRISEGANVDGLTPDSYHRPGEKLNEAINRSWNALQGAWASFRTAQEKLLEGDLGTTITRERWLLPLFRELDYGRLQTTAAIEVDGNSYAISHGWEHVPVHLVSYKLDLDKRTPGVAGASTASPHSLVQVALNRSDNHLWGFLSNGTRLRILRDNVTLTRQAYVEFDLEAMMDGEVYSDFVLLWLLCHQSRVEGERPSDCWLEKWMKVAEQQGTRALDQLRGGVEDAITAFGSGFLAHPANAALREKLQSGELDKQDYYRQLLRLVYRMLFLFVAEDRQIDGRSVLLDPNAPQDAADRYMKYYSTQRLRGMAESFKGTRHPDLFEGLRLVMRLLSGEGPHPKSLSQGERDLQKQRTNDPDKEMRFLRRGTKDAAIYEGIASKAMVLISRDLRQRQTPMEEILWEALRDRRLNDLKFRRQHPVAGANYVVDFLCYEAKLVVELDGGIHHQQKDADQKRQSEIEALGYRVVRFTNDDVRNDLQWVLATIAHAAQNSPLPLGEGPGVRAGQGLALVPLGSFLFSDGAVVDVIGCKIANQHLLDAVRALSLTYDDRAKVYRSVDYRNLGPEELGSVYESLLELHPQINVPARTFALATAGGNERKTTGSYYTPSSLINALLDSALDPVLSEAAKKGEAAILDLKICDPACGSGHFLIAAAHRIAKALASVRTGEEEPSPAAIQEAKRDVIGRCIYGVDINPMAVELCKVNLWMEALEPGKPLSFLESHIRTGNSLLGTTPKLMADGIPDDAFNPIEGDDKKIAAALKKANREARKQREAKVLQLGLFDQPAPPADYAALNRAAAELNTMDDDTLDDLRRKEAAYAALATGSEAHKARLLADAWCAAFVWEKGASSDMTPLTDLTYRRLENALRDGTALTDDLIAVINEVARLRDRYQFFHWHVTFPDVFPVPDDTQGADNEQTGWDGGFSCVLGNPPWERIKIEEKQWFAERSPDIANASNAAVRKRMIDSLKQSDAQLHAEFQADLREAEGESHFVRNSGRYPLSGIGDINTYSIFTETGRTIIKTRGYAGLIIPTGIATDDSLKGFFDDLIQTSSLERLIGFENEEFIFVGIANVVRFGILIMSGADVISDTPTFAFYLRRLNQIDEKERYFKLTAQDIALVNPNTLTSPIFRNRVDAELTRSIYQRVPVLEKEAEKQNPWGIRFGTHFHMANDSNLFFETASSSRVRLYEGKFIWHFDHRLGGFDLVGKAKGKGGRGLPFQFIENYNNPNYAIEPRYWIESNEFESRVPPKWDRKWFIAFREVTSAKLERTLVFSIVPYVACGNKAPLILPYEYPNNAYIACLLANLNSIVLDYVARQKIGGTALSFFIVRQLPVFAPDLYSKNDVEFIADRVLELVYTAWDVQAFAQDMGYHGDPFIWNEERRSILRAELDAYFAKLYGLTRDELRYVLDPEDVYGENFPGETFRVLKEKEIEQFGEYRTRRLVLEAWDRLFADE